jgi:hypothetical protein
VLPLQSCRLGRASVDFFNSVPAFGFVWSSRAYKVQEEMEFVMPESTFTCLIPETQDPETRLQFVQFDGRDSCNVVDWESPTTYFFCARPMAKKCRAGA